MKGQLFSLDFLIGLSIFIIVIGILLFFSSVRQESTGNIQAKVNQVSNFLVTKRFGTENILECSQLLSLAFLNYSQFRTELNAHPYDVWIRFENMTSDLCPAIRPKLDTMLVLDVSGSMCGTKMSDMKTAAKFFVDKFNESYDQAGLVSFSSSATLEQTLLLMTASNKTNLKGDIDDLECGGATNIGEGINLAIIELNSVRSRSDAFKIQVLLSDGDANRPVGNGPGYAVQKAREACQNKNKIYAISLGSSANRTLMQQIANITNGKEYYAPDSSQLQNIFNEISNDIKVVSDYGKIPPSSTKTIASVLRIVYLNGKNLQVKINLYDPGVSEC